MALMLMRGHTEGVIARIFGVSCETVRVTLMDVVDAIDKCLETPQRITWKIIHRLKPGDLWAFTGEKASLDAVVFNTTKPPNKAIFDAMYRRGKGLGLNVLTVVAYGGKIVYTSEPMPASANDAALYKAVVEEVLLALSRWSIRPGPSSASIRTRTCGLSTATRSRPAASCPRRAAPRTPG